MFNATFSNIMATSFSGGRSWSTWREPSTICKQLVNYHLRLRVECTLFCNLQSRAWILVIGLYELLGNPTILHYDIIKTKACQYWCVHVMTKKSTKYNIKLKEDLICSNENDNWWKKTLIHMHWVLLVKKTSHSHVLSFTI